MAGNSPSTSAYITEDMLEGFDLAGAERARIRDLKLTGFYVTIGRRRVTFFAERRIKGEKNNTTRVVGHWGSKKARALAPDLLTVAQAREAAIQALADMRRGEDPRGESRADGPTLADALALHINRLRKDGGSPRSISTIELEVEKHLGTWTARALHDITRTDCRELHERLTKSSGPYLANRVMRHVRALWNTALKEHDLPANPTIAVHWNKEERRQEPIAWAKLPAWKLAVDALESGLRRDYHLLVLLTGLRRMDAATIRWEHVDWKARTLRRPNPKGGKDRAFDIPLSRECIKILKRRQAENFDDDGWAFPTDALKEKECVHCAALGLPPHRKGARVHLAEPKEDADELVSPHRLRDTYTTALAEVGGISGYAIDVLTNHRPPRGTVTAGYIDLSTEHLHECQERVSKFLVGKMKPARRK